MAATSMHIEPAKPNCERHNQRDKPLSYVRSDLSHLNQNWKVDTYADRLSQIKENYEATTGQKMQAKATPIREGVVVIDRKTTLGDLRALAEKLEIKFGIRAIQISMHKDEGHKKSKTWKPNLHAHMVFDWTQKNGKSIKLDKQQMAEMQTICAEVLRMARGKSSDIEHLSAIQYKSQKESERYEELQATIQQQLQKIENLETKQKRSEMWGKWYEKSKNLLGITTNDKDKERLQAENARLTNETKLVKNELTKTQEQLKGSMDSHTHKDNTINRYLSFESENKRLTSLTTSIWNSIGEEGQKKLRETSNAAIQSFVFRQDINRPRQNPTQQKKVPGLRF